MTKGILAGVRVLDFGIITAGAGTSAMLADMGAEVIKIEGPNYIDPFRVWSGAGTQEDWWNDGPHFTFTNRGKKGLCVDLKSPAGRDVVLDLARSCDIALENFRVGALDGLGLGYGALQKVNPGIILAAISSQGSTGPQASSVSFGSTLEGSSGLASLIRSADGVPQISGHALNYPDQVVALFAVGAILSALAVRRRTGLGAKIDISQRELASFMIGEFLAAGSSPDRPTTGGATRLQTIAAALDGVWVAITIPLDMPDTRLHSLLGNGSVDEVDLKSWVSARTGEEAVRLVRAAGGFAAIARTAADLAAPTAPFAGSPAIGRDTRGREVKGNPVEFGVPRVDLSPAPQLGEHNREIALEVRSEADFERLSAEGIFATRPRSAAR